MPAINFSEFKAKILNGKRKQVMRPKNDYWLKWEEGDRLIGYWKMQSSKKCEKLFDSEFSEDPFTIKPESWIGFPAERGGFDWSDSLDPRFLETPLSNMKKWFRKKYGKKYKDMEFVVLRWR